MSDPLGEAEGARRRMWSARPGPALPLFLLGLVVLGGLGFNLVTRRWSNMALDDLFLLIYWVVASVAAYAIVLWVARRQGYRQGIWVDRRWLAIAGLAGLVIVVIGLLGGFGNLPGDLTLRGNVPLLAITVGLLVWAGRERRVGLWVVAILCIPLTLLANLYDMENVLFRLGVPYFANAEVVVDLGAVAALLLISATIFALSRSLRHGSPA